MSRPSFMAWSVKARQTLLSQMWDAVRAAHTVDLSSTELCTLGHSLKVPQVSRTLRMVAIDGAFRDPTMMHSARWPSEGSSWVPYSRTFQEMGLAHFLFTTDTTEERLQFHTTKRIALARLLYIGWLTHNRPGELERLTAYTYGPDHLRSRFLNDYVFHEFSEPILDAAAK